MSRVWCVVSIGYGLMVLLQSPAVAQHAIDVQRYAAEREYLKAMVSYDKLAKRQQNTDSVVAAARSAWALGLPERAAQEFDRALNQADLSDTERAKIILSRAILEYQEGRYQIAALHAKRATEVAGNGSVLLSRTFSLWGDALTAQGAHAQAEIRYLRAVELAAPEDESEIRILLGGTQLILGKLEEARANFEAVPLQHAKSAQAVRALARIASLQNQSEVAEFWLRKGREHFPNEFLDSWVDYTLGLAAIKEGNREKLAQVVSSAEKMFPPSDHWLNLLLAAREEFEWEQLTKNQ